MASTYPFALRYNFETEEFQVSCPVHIGCEPFKSYETAHTGRELFVWLDSHVRNYHEHVE